MTWTASPNNLKLLIAVERERRRRRSCREIAPIFRGAAAACQEITAREWIIGGPYETGKTWAALWRLDSEARRWPGGQFALVRKVRNDMDGSVLVTWKRIQEHRAAMGEAPAGVFGGEKAQWFDYPNGARVWVGGLDRPEKTLSGERDAVYVNQAEELDEHDWETLTSRTTGRGAVTETPMLFGDCNPGAEDHWIIRRRDSGALTLLESHHEDNPSLHDGRDWTEQGRRTMATLDALTGVRYQRGRLGLWVGAEGMYFTQLDEGRHLVDIPTMPYGWQAWAALDYGFVHLLSFGVFAQDYQGNVYLLGQHAAHHWYIPQHVTAMDDLLMTCGVQKKGLRIVAGHDCWDTGRDKPETIADTFASYGYRLERATTGRVQGARAIGERLGNPDCVPAIAPSLFINRRAKAVFDTLGRMVHDPRNVEDVLKVDADASGRGGDDSYDMLRYGVMAAPSAGWKSDQLGALAGKKAV